MKQGILTAILFFRCIYLLSQTIAPGGVLGPVLWSVASSENGVPTFKQLINDSTPFSTSSNNLGIEYLNFHPAITFAASSQLTLTSAAFSHKEGTYFTIYQVAEPTVEMALWHTASNTQANLILTTNRIADLDENKYINFIDLHASYPKLSTYINTKSNDSSFTGLSKFAIGFKPARPNLSISNFKGIIPEVIKYNRVLTYNEQLRVMSYLALKYGITLSEPEGQYFDSKGDILWSGLSYPAFHNNIAGIGRDEGSGWKQYKASSSNVPRQVTFSVVDTFANDNFFMWGDNDLPLSNADKTNGFPALLQRKWLIVPFGLKSSIRADLQVNTKDIDIDLPENPVYWLAIDRNDTTFKPQNVEFLKMSSLDSKGVAHFDQSTWDVQDGRKQAFSITVGQNLLVSAKIDSPSCPAQKDGRIEISVWGGIPPYEIKLQNVTENYFTSISSNSAQIAIPNLSAGKYVLSVVDKLNNSFKDNLYLNNQGAIRSTALFSHYYLPDNQSIFLDASIPFAQRTWYQWTGPENYSSVSPQVTISNTGLYTLTANHDGCLYVQDVLVEHAPNSIFKSVSVYPNPSTGNFSAKVTLLTPSPIEMKVYTGDGKLVLTRQSSGFAHYRFQEYLPTAGVYNISFVSRNFQETKRIVITK